MWTFDYFFCRVGNSTTDDVVVTFLLTAAVASCMQLLRKVRIPLLCRLDRPKKSKFLQICKKSNVSIMGPKGNGNDIFGRRRKTFQIFCVAVGCKRTKKLRLWHLSRSCKTSPNMKILLVSSFFKKRWKSRFPKSRSLFQRKVTLEVPGDVHLRKLDYFFPWHPSGTFGIYLVTHWRFRWWFCPWLSEEIQRVNDTIDPFFIIELNP